MPEKSWKTSAAFWTISLAVTTVYLRRLEEEQDKSWSKVAEAIGLHP
jgi:hypothetical protein